MLEIEQIHPSFFYSKKALHRFAYPQYVGMFTEPFSKGLRKKSFSYTIQEDCWIQMALLIDETDGIIVDATFLGSGAPFLFCMMESMCELLMRKNYLQGLRLKADLIEQHLRDSPDVASLPEESKEYGEKILAYLYACLEECSDIAISDPYAHSPLQETLQDKQQYPGWENLTKEAKLEVLERFIDQEIRPFIALDEGGIVLVDLLPEGTLIIAYEGACTSCHSATGATLEAIQNLIQNKIHPSLTVLPRFIS